MESSKSKVMWRTFGVTSGGGGMRRRAFESRGLNVESTCNLESEEKTCNLRSRGLNVESRRNMESSKNDMQFEEQRFEC